MKRNRMIPGLALTLLLLAGCAKSETQLQPIGTDEATRLAVTASGLTDTALGSAEVELRQKDGKSYYEVELESGGKEYKYDVDALSGVIIEAKVSQADAVTAATEDQSQQNAALDKAAQEQAVWEKKAEQDREEELLEKAILEQNARELEEKTAQTQDAQEKAALEQAAREDREAADQLPTLQAVISESDAKEIALEQVPGATADDIVKFHVDRDDGRVEYEGEIVYGGMEYEFEIDGYSGAIRDWDVEPVWD